MDHHNLATALVAQATRLENAAQKLRDAAEILAEARRSARAETNYPPARSNGATSRLEQLKQWLREHGPATRKEAIEESGIPGGTVRSLLNQRNFRNQAGRWTLKREDA